MEWDRLSQQLSCHQRPQLHGHHQRIASALSYSSQQQSKGTIPPVRGVTPACSLIVGRCLVWEHLWHSMHA